MSQPQSLSKALPGDDQRPTRIVLFVKIPVYRRALLDRLQGRADVDLIVADDLSALAAGLQDADAFFFNGSAYTDEVHDVVRERGESLRWFHSTSAGNEMLVQNGVPAHVIVTRSGGHSAPVVAEHAIALLLALARGLPQAWGNQQQKLWVRDRSGRRLGTTRSLVGRTAVVLGFGPIGVAIAHRLKALEMAVIAVSKRGAPHESADQSYPVDRLGEALCAASVLVVAAPGGLETRGLVGAKELAVMQPDGFVVNVGRGTVMDTQAVEQALRTGVILGAALDVVDPEPLPADHSLWDAPNLIITPHRAGGGDPSSSYRQADSVLDNLAKFRRGEALDHILATNVRD